MNRNTNPVQFPKRYQPQLPGTQDEVSGQMPLFGVRNAGPANVYSRIDSPDARDWTSDQPSVPLIKDEKRILGYDPDDPGAPGYDEYGDMGSTSGQFFEFTSPAGSSERQHEAYKIAHEQAIQEQSTLGYDAYPKKVNPDMAFRDLYSEEGDWGLGQRDYYTPEGTLAGRVDYEEGTFGPHVNYAEINPLYKGRGWSKDAMMDFMSDAEGIVHAGDFTNAGAGAFEKKGIPTERDLLRHFEEYEDQGRGDMEDFIKEGQDLQHAAISHLTANSRRAEFLAEGQKHQPKRHPPKLPGEWS